MAGLGDGSEGLKPQSNRNQLPVVMCGLPRVTLTQRLQRLHMRGSFGGDDAG